MNDHNEQEFQRFESLIGPWKVAYTCATNSYVALRLPEGPSLLLGRVLLEPTRTGINEQPFRLETQHIIAARFVADTRDRDVASVLAHARAGEMLGTEQRVKLLLESGGNPSIYLSPFYHPLASFGPRLPTVLVRGISRHNLLTKTGNVTHLDWELKASHTPFDSVDELLAHCGLPTMMQAGDSTVLEVMAKTPAAIGPGSTIVDGEATIECRAAAGLDVTQFQIGYKIFSKGRVDRGSVGGACLEWHQDGDIKTATYRMPAGDTSLLQTFLSYAGVCLHQWWVTDPQKRLNPRHAVHQIFDEDLELLRRMVLKPETDKPYLFEHAVSTLLSVLGFSITNYGRIPKLQRGPDIIAISPAGNIGVVECTLGLLDENDKLAKLVQRTKLVRDKLAGAGYAHVQLQSMIVTPLSRDEVTANLDAAGKHSIAVVGKEDLEGLLNQVSLPPNPDKLFEDAKRLIPSSTQGTLFRGPAGGDI